MKKGFTLAEVLITLSILGVVAALTIPSMVKSYQSNIYSVSLKKAVAEVNEALMQLVIDEHSRNNRLSDTYLLNSDPDCSGGAEKGACLFLKNYFKIAYTCIENNGLCMATSYMTKTGTAAGNAYSPSGNTACAYTNGGYGVCFTKNKVIIDSNGPDQPNIVGIDVFSGAIDGPPKMIDNSDAEKCGVKSEETNTVIDYTIGCFSGVIKNGYVVSLD